MGKATKLRSALSGTTIKVGAMLRQFADWIVSVIRSGSSLSEIGVLEQSRVMRALYCHFYVMGGCIPLSLRLPLVYVVGSTKRISYLYVNSNKEYRFIRFDGSKIGRRLMEIADLLGYPNPLVIGRSWQDMDFVFSILGAPNPVVGVVLGGINLATPSN